RHHHPDAVCGGTLGERTRERRRGRTHVVRDDDLVNGAFGPEYAYKGSTESPRDVSVDLVGHSAPNVVCLDELAQIPLWLRHEQQLTGHLKGDHERSTMPHRAANHS